MYFCASWLCCNEHLSTFWTHNRDELTSPVEPNTSTGLIFKSLSLVFLFCLYAPWLLAPAFTLLVSHLLNYEFSAIKQQLTHLAGQTPIDLQKLGDIRKHHHQLCYLVGHADEMFSLHVASTMLINIGVICIILFVLVADDWTPIDFTIIVFWTLLSIAVMMVTVAGGTMVNSKVGTLCLCVDL